ncbi:hypothetical protein V8F06_010033 [Rhypophila decipiens]
MPDRMSWIIVFNAKEARVITVRQLNAVHKIFVQNDDRFLYHSTDTGTGQNGSLKNWIIKAYDITAHRWIDGSLVLTTKEVKTRREAGI